MREINFYRKTGINYMNAIEQAIGTTMDVRYPALEDKFWKHADAGNVKGLIFVINQLAKILDDLRATVSMGL